jgi:hypothetical protein
MLPKFVKVFPHEYKRVLGVKRTPVALESGILNPASAIPAPPSREVLRG